jgi:hypothetical protein
MGSEKPPNSISIELVELPSCYPYCTSISNLCIYTVLCGHAIGHYNLSRACTNLEGARLQSFPDKWKFAGSHKLIQKQIGNAVPIGRATAVGKAAFGVYEDSPNWYYEESPPDVTPAPNPRRVTNTFAPPRWHQTRQGK